MKNIQRAYNICLPAGRPSSSFVTARLWRVFVIVIGPLAIMP